jgi:hypothetical protein
MPSDDDTLSEAARTRRTIRRACAILVLTVATGVTSMETAEYETLMPLFQVGSVFYLAGSVYLDLSAVDADDEDEAGAEEDAAD